MNDAVSLLAPPRSDLIEQAFIAKVVNALPYERVSVYRCGGLFSLAGMIEGKQVSYRDESLFAEIVASHHRGDKRFEVTIDTHIVSDRHAEILYTQLFLRAEHRSYSSTGWKEILSDLVVNRRRHTEAIRSWLERHREQVGELDFVRAAPCDIGEIETPSTEVVVVLAYQPRANAFWDTGYRLIDPAMRATDVVHSRDVSALFLHTYTAARSITDTEGGNVFARGPLENGLNSYVWTNRKPEVLDAIGGRPAVMPARRLAETELLAPQIEEGVSPHDVTGIWVMPLTQAQAKSHMAYWGIASETIGNPFLLMADGKMAGIASYLIQAHHDHVVVPYEAAASYGWNRLLRHVVNSRHALHEVTRTKPRLAFSAAGKTRIVRKTEQFVDEALIHTTPLELCLAQWREENRR